MYTLRNPDIFSKKMMTKRAWWLVLFSIVIPGSAQILAGSKKLGKFVLGLFLWFIVIAMVALAIFFFKSEIIISIFTNEISIRVIQILLGFWVFLWIITIFDSLRLARLIKIKPSSRLPVALLGIFAITFSSYSYVYANTLLNSQVHLLDNVFIKADPEPPIKGKYNILLLGVDQGEDREGTRPDSMTVMSIDAKTGETVMIGVPRDLGYPPISNQSPLINVYPEGYCDCNANGLYNYINADYPDLYPSLNKKHTNSGLEATKDAVEGITGLQIQYHLQVNMEGFVKLIDALGGVTINVERDVPLAPQGYEGDDYAWIPAGEQKMDGATALWYSRSRYDTTDWERMVRQRQIQTAIMAQVKPEVLLQKFNNIAQVSPDIITTDIPQAQLAYFVGLSTKIKKHGEPKRLELSGDNGFEQEDPDYEFIHQSVNQIVYPVKDKF